MPDEMREPPITEAIERMTTRVANSLVIAAAIIGLAIYSRPGPPRYEAVATPDGRVVRVNTRNGSIVSCDAAQCLIVHRHGDNLARVERRPALPTQAPPLAAPAQPPARGQPQAPAQPPR